MKNTGSYKSTKDTLLILSNPANVILLSGYSVLSEPFPSLHSQGLLMHILSCTGLNTDFCGTNSKADKSFISKFYLCILF